MGCSDKKIMRASRVRIKKLALMTHLYKPGLSRRRVPRIVQCTAKITNELNYNTLARGAQRSDKINMLAGGPDVFLLSMRAEQSMSRE